MALASHCLEQEKEKKVIAEVLKFRESFISNPNEMSPVEIIITEGYLVEYSHKW